jgi:hypothetical protein
MRPNVCSEVAIGFSSLYPRSGLTPICFLPEPLIEHEVPCPALSESKEQLRGPFRFGSLRPGGLSDASFEEFRIDVEVERRLRLHARALRAPREFQPLPYICWLDVQENAALV